MLGIDVSKETLACTLLDPQTHKPLWSRTYPNTATGVMRLLRHTPPASPWALEPTGRYSLLAATTAQAAGRSVLLAQPKPARHFLRSIQSRAKTDRLDSHGIGLFALCRPLPPYPLKSPVVEQLDQLLRARKSLAAALASFALQATEMPHAAPALAPVMAALETQKKALDQQIRQLTTSHAAFAITKELEKVPGIGPVTAATLAARLVAHDFGHSDAFVAYCGLDVGVRQSGKKQGQSGLTKQGDGELRRLLYLAAQANLRRKDRPFKAHYERERAKGLTSTAALCAVARKLARLAWSLHKHGTAYDPARVYQQNQLSLP
ncbi:MAG: IS110 family transposase [Abitibacteriaceae bacterium]|nr:IS110 family transposase [Abditibacteriaceae bacterium]MBV9863721.1 IS110 family transposase [Abditibacteriaceae bacterium]